MITREPIRVGIDGRELALTYSGIGRYVTELCKVLDKLLPCASFFVYSNREIRLPVQSPRWTARIDRFPAAEHLHPLMWLLLRARALCSLDRIDVFWGTMTILPRLPASVRAVVTVYDLFLMDRRLVSLKLWLSYGFLYKRSLADADSIVAISKATACKLRSVLGYEVAAVVRPGVSEHYRPRPAKEVEACLRLYGIRTPYIFTVVSRYERRKNLGSLFEAFCGLKADGMLHDHTLLLAGVGGSRALAECPLARRAEPGAIRALGQVPDDHLALLYGGADAFVFPSTHEGFGIPVAEAQACGTKVVATDIPELREAGGDHAIYVSPTAEGVRTGIVEALGEEKRQPSIARHSNTWEESGAILAKLLCGGDEAIETSR